MKCDTHQKVKKVLEQNETKSTLNAFAVRAAVCKLLDRDYEIDL